MTDEPTGQPKPLEQAIERLENYAGPHGRHNDAECQPGRYPQCAARVVLDELSRLRSEVEQMRRERDEAREALRAVLDCGCTFGDCPAHTAARALTPEPGEGT